MRHELRQRLTYANAMSTLAVFIALGGSSYAALKIDGRSIERRSIPAKKLKRNSITGREVRESRLRVAFAKNAGRLDGLSAEQLSTQCPLDTFATADVCIERTPRPAQAYGGAVIECLAAGGPTGFGRRLPTHGELMAALGAVPLAAGGELTSAVYPSTTDPGRLNVLYVTNEIGHAALAPDTFAGGKAFRCVTDPVREETIP